MAFEYVVARNPLGWLILAFIAAYILLAHILAFFVNGILCGAILWLVPVICLLGWFVGVMEDPWDSEAAPLLFIGFIWWCLFTSLFSIIAWILGGFESDNLFAQETDTLLGLVNSSINLVESGWEILVFIVILWFAISVIQDSR